MRTLTEQVADTLKNSQTETDLFSLRMSVSILARELTSLQGILADCKEESTAYQTGFQDGLDCFHQDREAIEVARRIGEYYLKMHGGNYSAAEEKIKSLCIRNIFFRNGKVCIVTARPGLLIGRKGEDIDKLTQFLGRNTHIIEAKDDLENYLIPRDDSDLLDYDYETRNS